MKNFEGESAPTPTPTPTPEPSETPNIIEAELPQYPGIIKYNSAKKIMEQIQMEKCICKISKIELRGQIIGTGFFSKIPFPDKKNQLPVLITDSSIIDEMSFKEGGKFEITTNEGKILKSLDLKNRMRYTSKEFGTTILEIKDEDKINNYLELEELIINNIINGKKEIFEYKKYMDETIYLMQYSRDKLSLSFGTLSRIDKNKLYHKCSTTFGSSGSPILYINNKVIGFNREKRIESNNVSNNFGTFLNFPIREFIDLNYSSKENENLLKEFNKKFCLDIKNGYIEQLNLNTKNLKNDGLIEFAKINFVRLKELNLSHNKITDIDIIQKVNFHNLEKLDFSHNLITSIDALAKVKNLNELRYLNFFDNKIKDINALEEINSVGLEYLNLGANKISKIYSLLKVNFKELKVLNLQINNISNIEVFSYVKYKIQRLNLCQNNINENEKKKENNNIIRNMRHNGVRVETDDSYNPPMNLGIIFDVQNDILSQLIRFDNKKSFFENILNQIKGEIITLINGKEDYPCYDVYALIKYAINYLSNENIIRNRTKRANFIELFAKNAFDEECITEIFERMNYNESDLYKLINSETIYNKFNELRNLLSQSYKSYLPDFFQHFDDLINKPSSLYLALKKIFKTFEDNYAENKYIIIISDGANIEQNSENINELINEAKRKNITIVSLYLTKNEEINKKIFNEFPNGVLGEWLKYLFDISSKVNYKNPVARYYIKKGYDFPIGGEGTLFLETNLIEINSFGLDLKQITYEGIDIQIQDLHYDNLIKFKYQFFTKNQIFGTCWANAYSAGIFLTNKRILGKKTESFETLRENLIKNASDNNEDGGRIDCVNNLGQFVIKQTIENFFSRQNIHVERRNEREAIDAFMKGRFIIVSFCLRHNQWNNNFSPFYKNNRTGILTEEILNEGLENDNSNKEGHAVLLIEITKDYYRLLNSWGSNWADGGTFKVKNVNILKPINCELEPEYYDIFFYEHELSREEQLFYANNNVYI